MIKPTPTRAIETSALLVALGTLAAGVWAMAAPHSFYVSLATFPPYSQHLIHDIGAFQIGLGACLAAGLLARDALLAALAGNALGSAAHLGSHIVDRADGGHAGDPVAFAAVTLLLTALTLARWATTRAPATPTPAAID